MKLKDTIELIRATISSIFLFMLVIASASVYTCISTREIKEISRRQLEIDEQMLKDKEPKK